MRLHIERQNSRWLRAARGSVVALMLLLWLGLVGAASSERLHGLLHSDAGHASHDCLVTHFAKGQLFTVGDVAGVVAVVLVFFFLPPLRDSLALAVTDVRLPSSRGPPAGSLLP